MKYYDYFFAHRLSGETKKEVIGFCIYCIVSTRKGINFFLDETKKMMNGKAVFDFSLKSTIDTTAKVEQVSALFIHKGGRE